MICIIKRKNVNMKRIIYSSLTILAMLFVNLPMVYVETAILNGEDNYSYVVEIAKRQAV